MKSRAGLHLLFRWRRACARRRFPDAYELYALEGYASLFTAAIGTVKDRMLIVAPLADTSRPANDVHPWLQPTTIAQRVLALIRLVVEQASIRRDGNDFQILAVRSHGVHVPK